MTEDTALREAIRQRYAEAATGLAAGCCSVDDEAGCGTQNYSAVELAGLPDAAARGSLGCGVPTSVAALEPGETVLDLGSGAGLDVLISARRVGPQGLAYGLDMTDEMLELARRNAKEARVENARFLKGDIEEIPLPDRSVDVVISNCVINLSTDKDRVLREAFRVLRDGGRLAVSDIVVFGTLPAAIRQSMESWVGCVAGALGADEYREKLEAAGFEGIELEVLHVFGKADIGHSTFDVRHPTLDPPDAASRMSNVDCRISNVESAALASAVVRARKPGAPGVA